MPYSMPEHKTVVFFSPKSGGTSLRAYLYHLENGFPFREHVIQGQRIDANRLCRNVKFARIDQAHFEGFEKIAVVRDPVRRFLSAYSNRVLHYGELGEDLVGPRLEKMGLPTDPDLPTFVNNLDRYARVSRSIAHHFKSQQFFLGEDPGHYDRIFCLEQIGDLVAYLNRKTGIDAKLPHLQTGGPKLHFEDVPRRTQSKILDIVSDDVGYRLYPQYRPAYAMAAE